MSNRQLTLKRSIRGCEFYKYKSIPLIDYRPGARVYLPGTRLSEVYDIRRIHNTTRSPRSITLVFTELMHYDTRLIKGHSWHYTEDSIPGLDTFNDGAYFMDFVKNIDDLFIRV